VLEVEGGERVQEQPVKDTLVMSMHSRKRQVGFPASVLHNGTHFVLFFHKGGVIRNVYRFDLVRAWSTDGLKWHDERVWQYGTDELGGKGAEVMFSLDFSVLYDASETNPAFRYKMLISEGGDNARLLTSMDGLWAPWVDGGVEMEGYAGERRLQQGMLLPWLHC
jgi:hypothetical protein